MRPVLFTITLSGKAVPISSYSFFMAAAAVFALAAAALIIRHYKLPFRKNMFAAGIMAISSFLGARLLYIILYFPKSVDPLEKAFTFNFSDFALYGGLGAGLLSAWIFFKSDKESLLRLLDILSPAAGISAAIAKVGCYLNGCCFGKVTNLPWGVKFPLFSRVHLMQYSEGMISPLEGPLPVHPVQIYELITALVASFIALLLLKIKYPSGYAFSVFGLTFTAGRFIVFFFRDFPGATSLSNFIRGPVTYGISIAIFIFLIIRIKRKSPL